ncbi:MAG TPA: hypothetical protein PKE47_00260 [Verrucomicrobiota bacterium]|nr:hypothetical protein [Verrucomicrobiota bacterium]
MRNAILTLLGLLCTAHADGGAQLASFRLSDQFGAEHRIEFPRSRPLLLVVGDRRGSEEVGGWVPPLKERWAHGADIVGVADVSAVPGVLRGRVTAGIRKELPDWPLLLDFEGRVTAGLPSVRRAANVFLVTTNGMVAAAASGPADAAKLAALAARVDTVVPRLR